MSKQKKHFKAFYFSMGLQNHNKNNKQPISLTLFKMFFFWKVEVGGETDFYHLSGLLSFDNRK